MSRRLLAVVLVIAIALVGTHSALAVVDDTGSTEPSPCALPVYDFKLEGSLAAVGLPVANSSLQIDGTGMRLQGSKSTARRQCEPLLFAIPSLQWRIVDVPPGQSASLAHDDTLSPTLTVAGPGAYRVRFTACANKCTLKRGGKTKKVGPFVRAITIEISSSAPVPPEYAPAVPALSPADPPLPTFSYGTRKSRCGNGGGFLDPEWVTTEPFTGPADYQLVEGETSWSKPADLDNFLNHDSQDFEWKVIPDPPYTGLAIPVDETDGLVKMEWETNAVPVLARPTPPAGPSTLQPGDRSSVFGYWIFDCGHKPFKTEIHPPVGVGVQRVRPVAIPSSFHPPGFPNGMGSNVLVPGIVTDIWFNRNSGENARCDDTALAQPAHTSRSGCLRQPHELNRSFTFHVYLPPSPFQRAIALGFEVPPVPLFIGIEKYSQGAGGPEPTVTVRCESPHPTEPVCPGDSTTWLDVTADFSGLGQRGDESLAKYGRRLSAAWAYPEPGNWGASRWRVFLRSIKVYENAEPGRDVVRGLVGAIVGGLTGGPIGAILGGVLGSKDKGDWRFYFNTNNRDQEWTQVFSCNGCIADDKTYKLNVRTGRSDGKGSSPSKSRNLGPDPVVFPGQDILVQTRGWDEEVIGDDIGTVIARLPQVREDYGWDSKVEKGSYRLNFSIRSVGSVESASLTPEATALLNIYTGNRGIQCPPASLGPGPAPADAPSECVPAEADPTFANRGVRTLGSLPEYESEGDERSEYSLTGIGAPGVRKEVSGLSGADRLAFMQEVRQELKRVPKRLRRDYGELLATFGRSLPLKLVRVAVPRGILKIFGI